MDNIIWFYERYYMVVWSIYNFIWTILYHIIYMVQPEKMQSTLCGTPYINFGTDSDLETLENA